MWHRADVRRAFRAGHGNLGVAFQAEVIVALNQQLRVDRAVRIVTFDATFPERFVFEYVRPRLIAVTLGTSLVGAAERNFRCGVDVCTVRIVASSAIHSPLDNRMMVLQTKLCSLVEVALETIVGILA